MKQGKTKWIILLWLVLITVAIALLIGALVFKREKINNNVKDPKNNENIVWNDESYVYFKNNRLVDSIMFSNIRIKKIDRNKCEIFADVENLTDQYLKSQNVTIKVIDDSGEVDEIFAGILTELAPYEPNTFKTQVLSDITDVVDLKIEVEEI